MSKTPTLPPATSQELIVARQKFEDEKLTRRAALRKFGITSGMAIFGMFATDDLARMVIKKMEQNEATRQIAETITHEFENSGIAFADASVPCGHNTFPACWNCCHAYTTRNNACNAALNDCLAKGNSYPYCYNLTDYSTCLGMSRSQLNTCSDGVTSPPYEAYCPCTCTGQ